MASLYVSSRLMAKQIRNLIKIAPWPEMKDKLQEELVRRDKEQRALFAHKKRGRERAKAEGR